ncbi:MAG: hypothetical protein H6737_14380 [Alphaproteobacteria bacterium]|nr:hypothetical protein [Alphaproteobacteria bacterium]
MSEQSENQQIGALAYGMMVLPASIAAAGFFPFDVPVWVWLGIAGVGGLIGGALFWERHPIAGGASFGLAGALSPFAVAVYVDSQMRSAPLFGEVRFNVFGLVAPPVVLLLVAFGGMVVYSLGRRMVAERAR